MVVMLDRKGLVAAFLIGVIIFYFGSLAHLALILSFLFLSVWATRYGEEEKKSLGIYEYERGLSNVLSNGLVPTIFAFLNQNLGAIPFISSVAAITADKFASELGVLSKSKPIFLLTFREVPPGTSGAISFLGTLMSLAGAFSIATLSIFFFNLKPSTALLIGIAGFIGCFADTLAGIFEEKGIGNKSTSNIIGSLVGGLAGLMLI